LTFHPYFAEQEKRQEQHKAVLQERHIAQDRLAALQTRLMDENKTGDVAPLMQHLGKRPYTPDRSRETIAEIGEKGEVQNAPVVLPLILPYLSFKRAEPGNRISDFLAKDVEVEWKTNSVLSTRYYQGLVNESKFIDLDGSSPIIDVNLWIVQDFPDGVFIKKYRREDFFGPTAYPVRLIEERENQPCFVIPIDHYTKVGEYTTAT